MAKKKRIDTRNDNNPLSAALTHIMNMETKPIILNPNPQECPHCEEMRRFVECALENESAADDLDTAQNRVESLLASDAEPFPEEEWNKACDIRDAATVRAHRASEAYYGFDRAKLRAALSTLKKQEPQDA